MINSKKQNGVSIIAAIFIIVVLGFMGVMFLTMVNTGNFTSVNDIQSAQALYVAEGGMGDALYKYRNGAVCNALGATKTLGAGSFTTSGTPYIPNPFTTVSAGGVSAIVTTIPVGSTANYAPHGRIRIDSEEIEYAAVTANSFTGVLRGAAGTAPAAHLAGAVVSQNLCLIRSVGSVSRAMRTVEAATVLSSKQGTFTKPPGAAPVNQSIAGLGFQPRAVLFFWTRQAANGFDAGTSINEGFGFASSAANQRVVSTTANKQNKSDGGRIYSEGNVIIFLTGGGPPTLEDQATLTSLDADGFTLRWTTNNSNNAYIIHYIAFGGDVTNATAGTMSLSTAAGNQSVNGLGFQPEFVLFLWGFTGNLDTTLARSEIGIGLASGVAAQGALVQASSDNTGNNADKRWQQRTDSCILILDPTSKPPVQDAIASFVSMDADGFTVNKSDSPAAAMRIFYLALRGGTHQVGAFNQPTATGTQSTAGVGFKPLQLVLASFNTPATNVLIPSTATSGGISFGAARLPAERGTIWFEDRSDQDNTVNQMNTYTANTNLLTLATPQNTVNARADLSSFDNDGFTLNWTAADPTARQVLYWAVGPETARPGICWEEVYQ